MNPPTVDGKIMVWFDCPLCRSPSKDRVALKDVAKDKIPVTCSVCLDELLVRNSANGT